MKRADWSFEWPEWVPIPVRQEIERFWTFHRGVVDWQENAQKNNAPEFGSMVTLPRIANDMPCSGRFVFAWNNIGRVVYEDGSYHCVSFPSPQDDVLGAVLGFSA